MSLAQFEVRRTGWDVVFGALLAIGGVAILAYAAFWTEVSVLFLGWMLVAAGVIALVASFFRIGKGGFWAEALTGALLGVLGLFMLTHTAAIAGVLTLVAGTLFLAGGVVRLVVAAEERAYRFPLILGGLVSVALGLIVLFNLFEASAVLLGVLLGVQVLVDGIVMMLIGRWHVTETEAPAPVTAADVELPGQRKPQEQRRHQLH